MDPMLKWKREAEAIEAAREAARAELAAAKHVPPPDWSAIDQRIQTALVQERKLILEAVGNALGQMISEQNAEDRKSLAHETDRLWAVLNQVQETINTINKMDAAARNVPAVAMFPRRAN